MKTSSLNFATAVFLMVGLAIPAQAIADSPKAGALGANPLSEQSILYDPEVPALGNPKGDITIVEYFDYRCPYCKKVHPEILKVAKEDGGVRVVFKDWPVFGGVSVYAARLVIASRFQNKQAAAHEVLISTQQKLSEGVVDRLLTDAGIDVDRAKQDLAAHQATVDGILARNHAQGEALGFQGTPAFIIGHFRVPGALDAATFKQAIAEARAANKKK